MTGGSHVMHAEILDEGLSMDCARCRFLAEHPDHLDEANQARLSAGHCYSDLDWLAAENLRRLEIYR